MHKGENRHIENEKNCTLNQASTSKNGYSKNSNVYTNFRINILLTYSFLRITKRDRTFTFSHPDYTVGFGIAPNPAHKISSRAEETFTQNPPSKWSEIAASITADREFHPAPKMNQYLIDVTVSLYLEFEMM